MSETVLRAVQASFSRRVTSVDTARGDSIVSTPWSLEDQTPVTLFVRQLDEDLFKVSDGGLAASMLGDAGADLRRRQVHESFALIRQALRFAPSIGDDDGEWDVAIEASLDDLGDAVLEVSEVVVRLEALKALGRTRTIRTFGDRIVQTVTDAGLRIEPKALLPLRHQGAKRRASYRVIGQSRDVFLQTITRASTGAGYDHAKSLFSDSAIDPSRRVATLEQNVRLEPWQLEGLAEVSRVINEDGLGPFLIHAVSA